MKPTVTSADLVLAAAASVWYAVPDYTDSRRQRVLVRTGAAVGGAGLAFWLDPTEDPGQETDDIVPVDGEPGEELPVDVEPGEEDPEPGMTPVMIAAVAAGMAASMAVSISVERRIPHLAAWMESRGWRRPNLVIGLVMGALTVAVGSTTRSAESHLGNASEALPTVS